MSNSLHSHLDSSALLDALHSRYATKLFDSEQKIDAPTWEALEKSLVLSPSSFGLQPWKFVVITDQKLKEQLLPHSWNQPSITSCSHLVVFFAKNEISEADVSHLIEVNAEIRGVESTSLAGYAAMINGSVSARSPQEVLDWNKHQVYIALGQFLVAAALLGVDACPMEGFSAPDYDAILGVEGYSATVIATSGYRSANDKYGDLPKVRYGCEEIIEHR